MAQPRQMLIQRLLLAIEAFPQNPRFRTMMTVVMTRIPFYLLNLKRTQPVSLKDNWRREWHNS